MSKLREIQRQQAKDAEYRKAWREWVANDAKAKAYLDKHEIKCFSPRYANPNILNCYENQSKETYDPEDEQQ